MGHIISLNTPNLDWEVLVRAVERSGAPLWLELHGTVQGVVLPSVQAQRLLGRYLQSLQDPEACMSHDTAQPPPPLSTSP